MATITPAAEMAQKRGTVCPESQDVSFRKMKDSGFEWIGEIPVEWKEYLLGQVTSEVKNKNIGMVEDNLLSLSYGKIKRKNINNTEGLLPTSFEGYNVIDAGDIVLRLTDLQNDHTSLRVGQAKERGIITSAYVTIRPKSFIISAFLYYLLHAFDIRKGFYGMGSGVRQGLTHTEIKTLKVVMPEKSEQYSIVSYLDAQCAEIDDIIASAKASIEDYKQWKASVIYEAVTKGLDPDVEMKDSGVDIIGVMPKHWDIKRQRFLCRTTTGNRDTQDAEEDGLYPFYVRSPIVERSNSYTFEGEGILMAGDGAGAGKVFHYATGKYAIHQRVYCFHDFNNILPRFYYYFMSNLFSVEIEKGSAKSTVPSVSMPMILNFNFCIPPNEEQKAIVAYLDTQCSTIDQLISEKETLIADLESYKKSLIYEVVTGKRRVYDR